MSKEERPYLTEDDINRRVIAIVQALDGAPIGQARHILRMAEVVIDDGHTVDVTGERFTSVVEEFRSSSVLSSGQPL